MGPFVVAAIAATITAVINRILGYTAVVVEDVVGAVKLQQHVVDHGALRRRDPVHQVHRRGRGCRFSVPRGGVRTVARLAAGLHGVAAGALPPPVRVLAGKLFRHALVQVRVLQLTTGGIFLSEMEARRLVAVVAVIGADEGRAEQERRRRRREEFRR